MVGEAEAKPTRDLLEVVFGTFRPDVVVAGKTPGHASAVPLLAGREPDPGLGADGAVAWVCADASCSKPITDPEQLRATLDAHPFSL